MPPLTPPAHQHPQSPPHQVVDGVTGHDDGGREQGDIELALFRRIRSFSNPRNTSFSRLVRGPSAGTGYRRYLQHPLSMFTDQNTQTSKPLQQETNPEQKSAQTQQHSQPSTLTDAQNSPESGTDQSNASPTSNESTESLSSEPKTFTVNGVAWRDATVQACAALLGKTIPQLKDDYSIVTAASAASSTAFTSESRSFEPVPRDFADYVIMTTLKLRDAFAMENATSWLFNIMDRTGTGYVLRDEFIRYAPFIGPVADAAVAGLVFDELIKEQVRDENERITSEMKQQKNKRWPNPREQKRNVNKEEHEGLRRRRASSNQDGENGKPEPSDERGTGKSSETSDVQLAGSTYSQDAKSRELFPLSAALRFDLWRRFFQAIQDKYNCDDNEWANVKQELGIDPGEALIKSQGALDHSDVFPTLGKLYLSQRYLIFFAAVGRNHYVARLGAVADVTTDTIPIMLRDCVKVHLESEAKAALDGVSPLVKEKSDDVGPRDQIGADTEGRQELTLSQHVGKLMKQFTASKKPLVFSLLEFRQTKRRDNWVNLIKEMVAAHKLHVQLGFGSSGRAVPSLTQPKPAVAEVGASSDGTSEDDVPGEDSSSSWSLNYTRSPFRNEPSPPLLVVAAHSNVARYRALRRVTSKHVSVSLLIFSRAERNTQLVNWYTDSVRSCDNQNKRTWIERAFAAIRENMDTNNRIYQADDDEPFDVGKLGDSIGRFAELCSPMARVIQLMMHLFQWRNPPATILAILVCITIATKGLVHYVPAVLFFLQAAWVVETKYNWLGLGMGRAETEDAERRQANVLALFAQVHDALGAAQNVLCKLNRDLGKVQLLFLWGGEEWQSWVTVGALCFVGLVLLLVPARMLFVFMFFMLFFKHFLPPTNPAIEFWQSLPCRIEERSETSRVRRRKLLIPRSGAEKRGRTRR